MKTKYLILVAALACTTTSWAQNNLQKFAQFDKKTTQGPIQERNDFQGPGTVEQELKERLLPTLLEAGFNAKYYNQDGEQSVDFKYKDKNYWYTVDKVTNGAIGLTLNTNSLKMYSDDGALKYSEEAVLEAINEINNKYFSMKMYYNRQKGNIRICQQTLITTAGAVSQEIVKKSLDDMEAAWEEYVRFYKDIAGDNADINTSEQPGVGVVFQDKPISKLNVSEVILESVDGNGNNLAFIRNGSIAHKDIQFIHPILVCSSSEVKQFDIDIKIINDKGEMLRYEDETEVTIKGQADIKKKGKEFECSMGAFGSPDYNDWVKGTYTVEVYEDGAKVATEQFTIK